MHIRNNFNERTVVHPEHYEFIDSPLAGVSRMMLERAGAEVARATSICAINPAVVIARIPMVVAKKPQR